MKCLLILVTLLFVQSDWVENVENSVKRVDAEAKFESEFEKKDNDGEVKVKRYKTKSETKIEVKYLYGKFMDLDFSYYENEKLLFAEIANGKDVILYKRKREKEEPYAVLIEKITYFNNENEGISKVRKLDIYENSDIKKLKSELKKMNFKIEKLNNQEYNNLKQRYNLVKEMKK